MFFAGMCLFLRRAIGAVAALLCEVVGNDSGHKGSEDFNRDIFHNGKITGCSDNG